MNLLKTFFKALFFITGIMIGIKILNRKSLNKFEESRVIDEILDEEEVIESEKKSQIIMKSSDFKLNSRQEQIMQLLAKDGQVEMKTLRGEFPSVTERTLRRDLTGLTKKDLIYKEGSTKAAKYYLN